MASKCIKGVRKAAILADFGFCGLCAEVGAGFFGREEEVEEEAPSEGLFGVERVVPFAKIRVRFDLRNDNELVVLVGGRFPPLAGGSLELSATNSVLDHQTCKYGLR